MLARDVLSPILSFPPKRSVRITFATRAIDELTILARTPEQDILMSDLVGLLFGTSGPDSVRIETVRQLPGHEPGVLMERFTPKQFDDVLEAARRDRSLESMQLLGWYRFHADAGLRLQPFEIQFHERFFPGHGDLAVVLTAHKTADPLACLCARSQDGTFSRTQYTQAMLRLKKGQNGEVSAEFDSGPQFNESAYIKPYDALENMPVDEPKKRNRLIVPAVWAVGLCALAGLFAFVQSDKGHTPPDASGASMSLSLSPQGSRLLITWSGGLARPKQARLKVLDGDSIVSLDLMQSYKPDGSMVVNRRSGNVQAILSVNDGFRNWESQSSLIDDSGMHNRPGSGVSDSPDPEIERLRRENQRLQTQINSLHRSRSQRRHRL